LAPTIQHSQKIELEILKGRSFAFNGAILVHGLNLSGGDICAEKTKVLFSVSSVFFQSMRSKGICIPARYDGIWSVIL